MQITYQERVGPDGEPLAVPVIPPAATADKIEAVVAVMTDELSAYLAKGVTPAGVAR